MMDIFVEGLRFRGYHGVYDEERRDGRLFEVDMAASVDTSQAASSDQLERTLDYRALAEIILEVGHGDSVMLVERLAETMCQLVFERYAHVAHVELTLRKFADGVPGEPVCVGVRLKRQRPI